MATSSLSASAHPFFERTGILNFFGIIVTGDEIKHGKPHPDIYLLAAEKLAVPPGACLVIEDAPAGIRAAHAGGMKVIALASTYPVSELQEADTVVRSLKSVAISAAAGTLEVRVAGEEMEAAR